MSRYDDDLGRFENDPVVQALTGPGMPEELSGEASALAAFRGVNGGRPHRRFAARIGTGGSIVIAAIALSGGVAAAAYTNALPAPVQDLAHDVAGPIGVPAHLPSHHPKVATGDAAGPTPPTSIPTSGGSSGVPAISPSTSPSPSASPSASASANAHRPGQGTTKPSPSSSADSSPSPGTTPSISTTATATPTPSPTDSATPTPTPTVGAPAALSISVSQTRVPANSGVQVIGALSDASGQPVGDHHVAIFARVSGGSAELLSSGQTAADGSVQFQTAGLSSSAQLVLRAGGGVHSAAVRVVVVPTMSAAVTQGSARDDVSISTQGAQPGDSLTVYEKEAAGWVAVDSLTLDGSGLASFSATPAPKRVVRYRVVLPASRDHAGCSVAFVTQPASGTAGG